MSDMDIGRIQRDLDTIRRAVEPKCAVSKEDVWHNLIIAVIGVVVSCTIAWSDVATRVDGGPNLWYVSLMLGAAAAVLVSVLVIAVTRKGESPSFFENSWKSAVAATFFSIVYFAFSTLASQVGFSLGALALATVFFAGAFQLASTFCEGWNPVRFGWGMAFVCTAFFLPFGTYETAGLMAGCLLIGGGLFASMLTEMQLRKPRNGND